MHRHIWPHLPLQLLPHFSAPWGSHLCLLPAVLLLSLFKPSLITVLPPSLHRNYTCQVHQWPPYCHIQWSNLSPKFDLSAAFYVVDYSTPLEKMSSLRFWNISLFGALLSLAFPSQYLCWLIFTVHFGVPQGAALGLGPFSPPGDLWPTCWQPIDSSIPDLSSEHHTHILNHLLNEFP